MGTHIGLFKWGTAAAFCSAGLLESLVSHDTLSYRIAIHQDDSPHSNPNNYTQLEFETGGTIDISSGWTEPTPGSGNWEKIFQTTPDYVVLSYNYINASNPGTFFISKDDAVWTYFGITEQLQDVCVT